VITSVNGSTITVKTVAGDTITVTTTSDTKVSVTKPITLHDLSVGDTVRVNGTTDGSSEGSTITAASVHKGDELFGRRFSPPNGGPPPSYITD
jgi:hypothetical protein